MKQLGGLCHNGGFMKKSVKIILAAAIALPIIVVAAIPLFVNANTFRPTIESRLSTALSRKVTLGNLRLSLTKGRLEANDLAIAEDPKFGQTPFFTAKLLHIGVEMKPLIFHHELLIRSFVVDAPQIHLIRAEDGTWNFSTLGHGTDSLNTGRPTALSDLPVDGITIEDGTATIETLPLHKNPQIYDHLNVSLQHFSLTQAFPFTASASLPAGGKVDVSGSVGPIHPQDAAFTAFDTQVTIQHLDPVAAGYVDATAGISMIASLDARFVSDGTNVTSDGKVHAEHLILLKGGRAAPNPLDVSYQIVHSLKSDSGQVSDLAFHTGAIAVHIKGDYQVTANVPVFDLKLLAQSVPINDLQAFMPAVGVRLPNGATLKGGTLSADFSIKGSPTDNVIVGSYEIKNTTLVGYDIGSKIAGIAALGGIKTGDTAVIDVSRANVRITKAGSESTKIYSVLPALGVSTGSGVVSPSGQLDFHLISKVTSAKGLNKAGINLLTKMNSTSDAAKPSSATGIPINITGTAEEPVITADVNGLMKGNAATLKKKLSKIFGKKQ
jgi:AsmA protein